MVWTGSLAAHGMAMIHPKRRAHLGGDKEYKMFIVHPCLHFYLRRRKPSTKLLEPLSSSLTGLNVQVLSRHHEPAVSFSTLVTPANLAHLIKGEVVDFVLGASYGQHALASGNAGNCADCVSCH